MAWHRKKRMKRRYGGRGPVKLIALRLYEKDYEFLRAHARDHGASEADTLRAMLERLAIPILKADPEALMKHEKEAYR